MRSSVNGVMILIWCDAIDNLVWQSDVFANWPLLMTSETSDTKYVDFYLGKTNRQFAASINGRLHLKYFN